jgi:hypothetical protein
MAMRPCAAGGGETTILMYHVKLKRRSEDQHAQDSNPATIVPPATAPDGGRRHRSLAHEKR